MPSLPANLDWLFFLIAGLLALGSLSLLFWSLFHDRDRKRAKYRCPKCWYDLTTTDGASPPLPITCSECGRVTTKPKHLRKTRRRYRYAFLALILLLASPVIAYYPRAQRNGLLSIIPTRFLIDTVPIFGYPSPLTDELVRRSGRRRSAPWLGSSHSRPLSIGERVYVLNRIVDGTCAARPMSDEWKKTYGALLMDEGYFLASAVLGPGGPNTNPPDPALEAAIDRLYEIPPQITLRTRPTWPREVPLWIDVAHIDWWPLDSAASVEVRGHWTNQWNGMAIASGIDVPLSEVQLKGSLTIDVRAEWGRDPDQRSLRHHLDETRLVAYEMNGSLSDALTPVTDSGIDRYVSTCVSLQGTRIRVGPGAISPPQIEGLGFGVIVDYAREGEVVATHRMWWLNTPASRSGYTFKSDAYDRYESGWERLNHATPGENWTVRIRSDPETALRVIDADKYWQGDVTIPLTIR